MPFCSNCGNSLDVTSKFCSNCGAPAPEVVAVPAAPVIVEAAPQIHEVPVVSVKAKILGFVGMGLGIGGLCLAVLGLLYTFIGIAAEAAVGFGMSIGFGLFSLPFSIVGRILCKNSNAMGNYSAACSVGSKMSLAGIIVSAVMLFVGFIGLFS